MISSKSIGLSGRQFRFVEALNVATGDLYPETSSTAEADDASIGVKWDREGGQSGAPML